MVAARRRREQCSRRFTGEGLGISEAQAILSQVVMVSPRCFGVKEWSAREANCSRRGDADPAGVTRVPETRRPIRCVRPVHLLYSTN